MRKTTLKLWKLCIALAIVSLWRCSEEPVGELNTREDDRLTTQKANELYDSYMGREKSRGMETATLNVALNPGELTVEWNAAVEMDFGTKSFVNVPIIASRRYMVFSPEDQGWVPVTQKLVMVQDDTAKIYTIYLLSIIPEGRYREVKEGVLADSCHGSVMPADFSGRIIYTNPFGGLPFYVGAYQDGRLTEKVFLFDKEGTFEENLQRVNRMLEGYRWQEIEQDSRSVDMGWENNPGGGNDWNYQPGGGSSGGSGDNSGSFSGEGENNYTWIDTDGDGIADSVLLDDVDVTGNSGNSGNSDSSDNSSEVPPYFPPINPDTPGGPNPGDITLPPYGGGGYTPSDPDPGESHTEGETEAEWWGPGHNKIIKAAFEGKLTDAQIEDLKEGSRKADTKEYQTTDNAYMHAMIPYGSTLEEAVKQMRAYFINQAQKFRDQGSYYELGRGLHMIMDAYSPPHSLKVWKKNAWYFLPHVFEWSIIYPGKIDKAAEAISSIYDDLSSTDLEAGEIFDSWYNGYVEWKAAIEAGKQ